MDDLTWLRWAMPRASAVARRLREAGLSANDLDRDALAAFPSWSRDQWRADWRDLAVWDAVWAPTWEVARSSGSTGAPVSVVRDRRDVRQMWEVLRRLGVRVEGSVTALWCTLPTPRDFDEAGPYGRMMRISARSADAVARVEAAAPTILFTDPAGLCDWVQRAPKAHPTAVLSSAMQLTPTVRKLAEAALRTNILDYWSTTETGPIAVSCGAGFHVLTGDVWVESVAGELLVTRLRPGASVVLRWRSGDRGAVAARCPCGHVGDTIIDFEGRNSVWFTRRDGVRVDAWSLAPSLKSTAIWTFRLTQVGFDAFELEASDHGDRDRCDALGRQFGAALAALGWPSPRLAVRTLRDAPAKPEPFRVAFV
jgi:phenylacetate-CoA ligase